MKKIEFNKLNRIKEISAGEGTRTPMYCTRSKSSVSTNFTTPAKGKQI